MDQPWKIEMLGGLRVCRADTVITRFKTHKNGALLAYLAYHLSRVHTREALINTFWPEADIDQGRPSLSVALSSLRHQLEPPGTPARSVLVTTNTDVRLNPIACTTDVKAFEDGVQSAKCVGAGPEEIDPLTRAVTHYQGELLPGYYEDWCLVERERLQNLYVQTLRALVRALVREREIRQAIPYAEKAFAVAPLQEELCRDLMQLYTATGQPSLALQQYRTLEERLQREFGERPAASTQGLADEISGRMQQAPPARVVVAPAPVSPSVPVPAPLSGMQTLLAMRHGSLTRVQRESLAQRVRLHGGQEAPGWADVWWAIFARCRRACVRPCCVEQPKGRTGVDCGGLPGATYRGGGAGGAALRGETTP